MTTATATKTVEFTLAEDFGQVTAHTDTCPTCREKFNCTRSHELRMAACDLCRVNAVSSRIMRERQNAV